MAGSRQALIWTADAKRIVEEQMCSDDETTGVELQKVLAESGVHVDALMALRW